VILARHTARIFVVTGADIDDVAVSVATRRAVRCIAVAVRRRNGMTRLTDWLAIYIITTQSKATRS
jgi:hypothetical protein